MIEVIAWLALIVFFAVGMIGVILPGIPGFALIFLGVLIHKLLLPHYLSWWVVAVTGVTIFVSWGIDLLGTSIGAKWGGASRAGIVGALIGAVVGLFFGVPGIVLGPIVGAFTGEMVHARRTVREASVAGVGAGVGIAISTVLRGLLAIFLLGLVLIDCFT